MLITENIKRIKEKIAEAAIASGRSPDEITLVAATKTQDYKTVREAILAGADACGENRVQELEIKNAENAYAGAPLHFIGHLQNNKVRKIVGIVDLIQSADQSNIDEISRQAAKFGIVQDVLLQINIGAEPQKGGVHPDEVDEVLYHAAGFCPNIRIMGLMAIPPVNDKNEPNYEFFDRMLKIYVDKTNIMLHNSKKPMLSMGMSGDYETAVCLGATMVRVGSAIFGERA